MLKSLIGKTVTKVYRADSMLILVFDDNTKLEISDDYSGFTYNYPSEINPDEYDWMNIGNIFEQ
jgi:hypothetical protein